MKKTVFYLFMCSMAVLNSCSNNDTIEVPELDKKYINTFESTNFWGNEDARVKKGQGHSGNYFCVIDSINPFSITFVTQIGKVSNSPLKKISGSAFAKCKNTNGSISFGAQIETIGADGQPKTTFIPEAFLEFKNSKINEWVEIKFENNLPLDTKPNDKVKVFVFNKSKEEIQIDDIKIWFE